MSTIASTSTSTRPSTRPSTSTRTRPRVQNTIFAVLIRRDGRKRTHRVGKAPVLVVELDDQGRFPFPRLFEHRPREAVVVVPRRAGHGADGGSEWYGEGGCRDAKEREG